MIYPFSTIFRRMVYLLGLMFIFVSCSHPGARSTSSSWDAPSNLGELSQQMAHDLKARIGTTSIYFDVDKFTNLATNDPLPLSRQLHNNLEASLTAEGFRVVDTIDAAQHLLAGEFQLVGQDVDFYFKVYSGKGESQFYSFKYAMSQRDIPEGLLRESLESKARKMAKKLLRSPKLLDLETGNRHLAKVFINPIVEKRHKYTTPFSEYFLSQVSSYLTTSDQIEIIRHKPMQTRSLVPILKAKAKKISNLNGSDALLNGANAVLSGTYYVENKFVTVSMEIIDTNGTQISVVDQKIPRDLINLGLDNPLAEKLAEPAGISNQSSGPSFASLSPATSSSPDNQVIKISTDKGSEHQTYVDNEPVTFLIQVTRPLYVYVYSFNSQNEVSLIYPMPNDYHGKLRPHQIYTIPPENSDWEIIVQPPYGLDVVKVFATDKPIPLPRLSIAQVSRSFVGGTRSIVRREKVQQQLASQKSIYPLDLVDYFKGTATQLKATLFEDNIFVQTRAN